MTSDATPGHTPAEIMRARLRMFGLLCGLSVLGLVLLGAAALDADGLGARMDGLGVAAAPALVLLGTALIVAMVPASLVAGAAGFAVGTVAGTGVAVACATLGATLCALVGRHVGTPAARHALGPRVARSVGWADDRPLRSVITLRLVPGLPFNATSYALGFTSIRLRDVALGTAVGYAPRCFAYAALGGALHDLGSPEAEAALIASAVLLLAVIVGPRLVLGRTGTEQPERAEGHGA
jgi:uncharacterized membrane protein YdjX (TVP38/TMEM64 family)